MPRSLFAAVAASMLSVGCTANDPKINSAAQGSAVGAMVGAVGGGLVGGASGSLAGAAVGAGVGGAVGLAVHPGPPRAYYRDTRGNCYYIDQNGQAAYDKTAKC
jgi:uncharacterized protein YcfJ